MKTLIKIHLIKKIIHLIRKNGKNKKKIKNNQTKNTNIYAKNQTTIQKDQKNNNISNKTNTANQKTSGAVNSIIQIKSNESLKSENTIARGTTTENTNTGNTTTKSTITKNTTTGNTITKNTNTESTTAGNTTTKNTITENTTKGNTITKKTTSNSKTKKQKDKSQNIKKGKTKKIILFVLLFLIIAAILTFSVIFAILTKNSNKIISGISVNGIDISNLTKDEATEKLNSELSKNLIPEIKLTRGDYSYTLDTASLDPSYNLSSAVNQAYDIGRIENNIFENNFEILSVYFNKKDITTSVNYNSEKLDEKITILNNELPDKVIDSSYKIENNNLIISNSYNGYRVQNDVLKNNVLTAISKNINTLEIPVEQFKAESVDIEAIHNQIYKAPINASYSTNPYTIHKEQDGLDFAITMDEAKKLISQNQETYTIPLKAVKPKVTVKNLPQEAFPNLLATYTTTYSTANSNRATNVYLSANAINNYILMPDEVFSYNNVVGKRTAARGYKEATVYVNGEVANGIGGGICQVSSTLYNSVLLTNLQVTDRSNHAFEPSYVPAGQDATVSWGAPDFKFKNNRNYPIKIVSTTGGGKITVSIYGLKTANDYEVKIRSSKIGSIPYTTKYEDDPSLPAGTEKVIQNGSNGCKSQTYKILYKNGVEVSRTLISTDSYRPHNKVVRRGTKVVQKPTPTPIETPQNPTPSVTITNEPAE